MAEKNLPSLPDLKSYEQACLQMDEYLKEAPISLNNVNTHLYTKLMFIPDGHKFAVEAVKPNLTRAERSAVVGNYLTSVLKNMAPYHEAYWLLNSGTYKRAMTWFKLPEAKTIVTLATASKQSNKCPLENMKEYERSCKSFRVYMADFLANQSHAFATVTETAVPAITIPVSTAQTVARILENIIRKHNEIYGGNNQTGLPHYNIDIIFNFYLWAHISVIKLDAAPRLNIFLYLLGRKILGSDKVKKAVAGSEFKKYSDYFNETNSKYMPPYAITARRMYDHVAVFGVLNLMDIKKYLADPGVSPRYLVHLKSDSPIAMKFICKLWLLEELEPDDDIRQSEKMFNELLIQKYCAYVNSVGVDRNIGVRIIPLENA